MNKKQTRKQTLLELDQQKMAESEQEKKNVREENPEGENSENSVDLAGQEKEDKDKEEEPEKEEEEDSEEENEEDEKEKIEISNNPIPEEKTKDKKGSTEKKTKKRKNDGKKNQKSKKTKTSKTSKNSKNYKDSDSEEDDTSDESSDENSFRKNGYFDHPFKSISIGNKGPIRTALNKITKLQSLLQEVDAQGGDYLVEFINEIQDLKNEISQIIKERNKGKLEHTADKEKLKILKEYLNFMISELRDERCGTFSTIILGLAQDGDVAEILGTRRASRLVLKCKEAKKNYKNLGNRALDQVSSWNKRSNNHQNGRNRFGLGSSRQSHNGYGYAHNSNYNNGHYGGGYFGGSYYKGGRR